ILMILPGEIGYIIECTLEVVNLDEKPDYEALSYCWGPTSPPVTVLCNNQPTRVTPDLGATLQRLRYPKGGIISKGPETTLDRCSCINQQDLEERSKQVSLMKDIYDSAKNVVIWLG
ncbi:heterokaryon incompatibility protein-domain-containing protein, partial [Leptodontidium sp. 2 PMI_412]